MSGIAWRIRLRGRLGGFGLDVDVELPPGPTLLVGPNGAGKTTVLRAIAGAAAGFEGRVALRERTLLDTVRGIDLPPEARQVGYVPQGLGLFPHLSVLQNVAFGCGRGEPATARARATLEEFEAMPLASRRPDRLSGGEGQRVALARALACAPVGLLLDEPLSALDIGQRRGMRKLLCAHLLARGLPAIVVTHDLRDVLALGGTVVVLEAGRVVQQGTAQELARGPATDFVEALFEPLAQSPAGSATSSSSRSGEPSANR